MPGVLQLEAMAQLAGMLLLRKLEYSGKLGVLLSMDKVKLRGGVTPGDQLRLEVETLRIKGKATLHTDPEVLEAMSVKGRPALLYTRVKVEKCFFHCGKALIRSHLWEPARWPEKLPSIVSGHRLLGKEARDEEQARKTNAALEQSYTDDLY